ncbi:hypothetical protein [uncultured Tateyamaria sp.]|uniref:hypothetical protein n=1 Tax=uncultured Tateyamaria sp. TaxID=455651 RepID=UPI0026170110|nr:hypothetical protein [uncultured Tateyamaria sp.]
MADQNNTHTSSGNTGLGFIVGALVVVVGVIAYAVFTDGSGSQDLTISIEGADSAVEQAAETLSGS